MRERNDFLTRMRRPHMPSLQMQAYSQCWWIPAKYMLNNNFFFTPNFIMFANASSGYSVPKNPPNLNYFFVYYECKEI
jgi:hypothetical protein